MPLRWQWDDRARLQRHDAASPELQHTQEALLEAVLGSAARWKTQVPWGSLEALLYKLHTVGHRASPLQPSATQAAYTMYVYMYRPGRFVLLTCCIVGECLKCYPGAAHAQKSVCT